MPLKKAKSVDSIIAKLQRTIDELDAHANEQLNRAVAAQQRAVVAQAEHEAHSVEYGRARKVAGNIKDLLT